MKRKRTGFTVVEILTVVTIIAILLGVLLPTFNMVRGFAKETKQKAQIAGIELALLAFRGDYGDYPPSECMPYPPPLPPAVPTADYCGAQKLAEALLGWDLLGFHRDSAWKSNGLDDLDTQDSVYDPPTPDQISLDEREDLYLELGTANAFRLQDLFDDTGPYLNRERFVLCDTFKAKSVIITGSTGETVTRSAGTPILYYRANTSSKYELGLAPELPLNAYNSDDNVDLINLGSLTPSGVFGESHKLVHTPTTNPDEIEFYEYITDPQLFASTDIRSPYNPDSYILISAGLDGLYGTEDDITNFGN